MGPRRKNGKSLRKCIGNPKRRTKKRNETEYINLTTTTDIQIKIPTLAETISKMKQHMSVQPGEYHVYYF